MSKIKKSYINIASGQIHYRYIEGDGQPLLFFHRTPSSSIMFERLMLEMKNDRPLFAFDTPGFGESFNPDGMPSLEDYRDWFIELINKIGLDQFHIYAHHTGTHIASEIALKLEHQILSLCLNGAAYLTFEEREMFQNNFTPALEADEKGEYLIETFNLIKTLFPTFDPDLVDLELRGALRSKTGRNQAFNAIWKQDFMKVLSEIKCPILAMSSIDDFFIDQLELIKEDFPLIRTAILKESRIASTELQTEATASLIRDFIKEVEEKN